MAASRASVGLRIWLFPLSILLGVALCFFVFTYWVDARAAADASHVWGLFFRPNATAAAATISNAGEVVASILAIAITVVAIVVELAANRYTHRITELFVASPINFIVPGFFVVTALQCLWVSRIFDDGGSVGTEFVPIVGFNVAMTMLAICLLILLPYFAFVFTFLNPIQIVDGIRQHTVDALRKRMPERSIEARQFEAIRGIEQLADVALNAMENKDKGVSMASVDALQAMIFDYGDVRGDLSDRWFEVEGELAHNPDFVSMSSGVLRDVSDRRYWFEMKVLRQYQTIYGEALNRMRDINYLIAINTRQIGEYALRNGNDHLVDLVLKFFNTYLRATINARDVRTAYNVLNQYRLLAEALLSEPGGLRAIEIVRYFKYYGTISFNAKLPFILETVAYDLSRLIELAYDRRSSAVADLLKLLLEVDKESESEVQEMSLRGVRKAQTKLATHFLVRNDDVLAREIFRDMEGESAERLGSIRDELLNVQSPEFWEISDRGVNFDYLPPEEKTALLTFFGWFGDRLPSVRQSKIPSVPPGPPSTIPRKMRVGTMSLHDVPGLGRDPGADPREEYVSVRPPADHGDE